MTSADLWEDTRRVEAWAGEVRVNLIRLAAIIGFYGYHLINVYLVRDRTLAARYHAQVTALTLIWAIAVVLLHVCLTRRYVPPALKYVATVWDILLVTALVGLATPRSPLVVLYFLVIAAAPLRLSLRLVYVATLGSMAGYLLALGYYAYVQIGYNRYYNDAALRIPRSQEIIFLLALGGAGLLAGQFVRQARRLVAGYPVAVEERREG